jgi:hypothetical protein
MGILGVAVVAWYGMAAPAQAFPLILNQRTPRCTNGSSRLYTDVESSEPLVGGSALENSTVRRRN